MRRTKDPSCETVPIYALSDPRTGEVRYIGESIDPNGRLRLHRSAPQDGFFAKWIIELRNIGLQPEVKVVATVSRRDCYKEEQKLIRDYRQKGSQLLNRRIIDKPIASKPVHRSRFNARLVWKQGNHIFNSAAEAGRYFGVSGGTVLNWVKRGNEPGKTLTRIK